MQAMITPAISALALIVSVVALFLSARRGQLERERTIRSQLSETLRQYAAALIERQKVLNESDKGDQYQNTMTSILDQQQGFLVQQANYLADQIPSLVNSLEWTAIASGNTANHAFIRADSYYRRALQVAPDSIYRLGAAVAYAWFLYMQRRFEEARETYRQSLAKVMQNDDFARYQKGRTYMFWGMNERDFVKSASQSQQAFESAAGEFGGIALDSFRENAQKELDRAKQGSVAATNPTVQVIPGQANT